VVADSVDWSLVFVLGLFFFKSGSGLPGAFFYFLIFFNNG
jgi:hypothetical protein